MQAEARRALLVATSAYVLGILAQNTYLFYVAPVAVRLGGASAEAGSFVFAASAFAMVLTVVPCGWLADRWPRRRVMRAGLVFLAAAYVPVLVSTSLAADLVASLLSGTGLALLVVSFNSYVADLLAAGEMSTAYGRAGAIGILVSAVGPFAGALIFTLAPTPLLGLQASCIVFALAGIAGALLTLALPHQGRILAKAEADGDPVAAAAGRRALRAASVFYLFVGVSFGMTTPYFATLFLDRVDAPTWGILLGGGTIANALALLAAGAAGARHRATPLLVGGQALAAAAAMLFLIPLGVPALGATYWARLFFANAFSPIVNTLLMTRVVASSRGVTQGWASAAWNLGWTAGALAGGRLVGAWGWGMMALGGAIGLLGALVAIALMRRLETADAA